MNSYAIDQLSAISALIFFLMGITFGLVVSVSWASRLEDDCNSLLGAAPSALAEGVRVFQGHYTRRGRAPAGQRRRPGGTRNRSGRRDPDGRGTGARR